MAEKDLWRTIKKEFDLPGRIKRIEAKGVSGIPDVTGMIHSIRIELELKAITKDYDNCTAKDFPWGLKGSQAVELFQWAKTGAVAYLVVSFGKYCEQIHLYEGSRLLEFITNKEKYRSQTSTHPVLPEPDFVVNPNSFWYVINNQVIDKAYAIPSYCG